MVYSKRNIMKKNCLIILIINIYLVLIGLPAFAQSANKNQEFLGDESSYRKVFQDAYVYFSEKKYILALNHLELIRKDNEDISWKNRVLFLQGLCFFKLGYKEEAKQCLDIYVKQYPYMVSFVSFLKLNNNIEKFSNKVLLEKLNDFAEKNPESFLGFMALKTTSKKNPKEKSILKKLRFSYPVSTLYDEDPSPV